MMMNFFSIFDPTTSMYYSLNWISMLITLIFLPMYFWVIPSRYTFLWNNFLLFLFNEFKISIKYSFSNLLMFVSLFVFISLNNFLGLIPYIFTLSSHMSFCLSLSLTFWISMMLFGWSTRTNFMFSHLTPQNTPYILIPFMVLIESISLIIRPITLSIRFTANMIAGHLLLTLIGSSKLFFIYWMFPLMFILQLILMMLELAVSLIQAYVFSILSLLYSSEI